MSHIRLLQECISELVIDFKQLENGDSAKIAATIALGTDLDFDWVSLGIDPLVWRRWNKGLVEFVDATGWNSQFLQELRTWLERLLALIAESPNQSLSKVFQ